MQRGDLQSVPFIATRLGLICVTSSSGTVPPEDEHSPQKKDTRKWEQQAPQFRHGLTSDMGEGIKGIDREIRTDPAAILGFAADLGRGARNYFFVARFCRKSPGFRGITDLSRAYVSLQCHGQISGRRMITDSLCVAD
ncbi:hypothetical protein EMIT0P395_30007 [Pseudomonas sp. IT-P395]